MNKYVLHELWTIKKRYESVQKKNEQLLEKASKYFYSAYNTKNSDTLNLAKFTYSVILASISSAKDMAMYRHIKEDLVKSGLYKEHEIALELNEFLAMGKKAKVIIGPIDYRAYIAKEDLENVELIWFDASFVALDQAKYLKSLRYVMGDLVLRDLDTAIPLELTGGRVDLSRVSDLSMLPNYKVALDDVVVDHYSKDLPLTDVLGNIYIVGKDAVYNSDDFDNLDVVEGDICYKTNGVFVSKKAPIQKNRYNINNL